MIAALGNQGLAAEAALPETWAADRNTPLSTVALFLAESRDEGPAFLDFILKGVLRHEQPA